MTEQVLHLLDVSAWQGQVDWPAVKAAGISGALCKIGEGVGSKDPTFDRNWPAIKEAGLVRGCYFFARLDLAQNTPEAEADWFLSQLPPLDSGDIIAYDCEVGQGDLSAPALRWLQRVAGAIGFRPLVYSYISFIRSHLQQPGLAAYDLWLSAFGDVCPASCPPWPSVALWQFTDAGVVPGVSGPVDMSSIARSPDGLKALGKPPAGGPSPASPPAEKPPAETPVYRFATVTTDMWLRRLPRADSARLVNLPVGTVLPIYGAPTPNWANVRAPNGQVGWVKISNVHLTVERPS